MFRWNRNYETVTGYIEELPTRNALDPIHEEDRPRTAAAITGVFTEGYGDVEARMVRPAKPSLLFTGSRLQIGDELYVAGVGVDISERKRARPKSSARRAANRG